MSVGDGDVVNVRGILLDVTLDSPAKALWLQMKQFNGYCGCSKCKEKGCRMSLALKKRAETDSATYTPTMLPQAVVMVRSEGMMSSKSRPSR